MVIRPNGTDSVTGLGTREEDINTLKSYDNLKGVDRENCAGRVMEGIRNEKQIGNMRLEETNWVRWMG